MVLNDLHWEIECRETLHRRGSRYERTMEINRSMIRMFCSSVDAPQSGVIESEWLNFDTADGEASHSLVEHFQDREREKPY